MKKLLVIFSALALLLASVAYAAPGGVDTVVQTDLGSVDTSSGDSVDLTGGNITQANLSANMSTNKWAGLLGNVTGQILLADANDNALKTWNALGNIVYASTAAAPQWSNAFSASAVSDLAGAGYSYLVGAFSDNFTNTFDDTTQNFDDSNIIAAVNNAPRATTTENGNGDTWETFALTDGAGELVFAGVIQEDTTSYIAGNSVDYQMLIPEDESAGNVGTTTYNLWVELI